MRPTALLTGAETAALDRAAEGVGVSVGELMAAAGAAVADAVERMRPAGPILVLCGPGNNGGDGFVAARRLRDRGHAVRLALLGPPERLSGAAGAAARQWGGPILALEPSVLTPAGIVVDALFGAGLSRPLEGPARSVIEALARLGLPVVAVDVPSGVHGDSGAVLGAAAPAAVTVTFVRRKPAHLLFPGRALSGRVDVADIGMPAAALRTLSPRCDANEPALWRTDLPRPDPAGHKYGRGHALVVSGPRMTGAARLAARSAQRTGAGLVTVASPDNVWRVHAAALDGVLVAPFGGPGSLARILKDRRINSVVLGPGAGRSPMTRRLVRTCADSGAALVLDADALTVFSGEPHGLAALLDGVPAIATPHAGEFRTLFGRDAMPADRLSAARSGAAALGAIMVLKGPDTIIAAPDGRAAINGNAPPHLATAGSGDCLAGIIAGLLAQGMAPWVAACAGVWLHGAAGAVCGRGLIADDLPDAVPRAFSELDC